MSFVFSYQFRFIDNRKIPNPKVQVAIDTVRGKRTFSFIMDTGADELTFPHYMMKLLDVNKRKLKESAAQGVGKTLVKTWEGKITITFCSQTFSLPCSFTDNDRIPLLLGKEGIFDRFNVIFDNDKQMTVFEKR